MELSTVVTKGQIKVFFLLTVLFTFNCLALKMNLTEKHSRKEHGWNSSSFDSLLPENMMNCNSELPIFFVLLTKSYSVTSSIII